ncbi:MAG: hypothetical protein ACI4QM_01380 [Alphaproteobacteria bacterium]
MDKPNISHIIDNYSDDLMIHIIPHGLSEHKIQAWRKERLQNEMIENPKRKVLKQLALLSDIFNVAQEYMEPGLIAYWKRAFRQNGIQLTHTNQR